MKKDIDIIIPVFKAHKTITKTLSSITMQNNVDKLKVTLVNDCCPEGDYQDIVKQFSNLVDIQELKLEKNSGPGVARQYGIDHTYCPYIVFADADDTFLNSFALSQLYYAIEEVKENVIFSSFIEQNNEQVFIPHDNDYIWIFSKIYKRSFLKKHNIRFTTERANEDSCFNKKINMWYLHIGKDIQYIDVYTYGWHITDQSITRNNNAQYTYDQSICGFVNGMIECIEWAEKQKIKKEVIIAEIRSVLIFLYTSFCDVGTNAKEYFQLQNWYYIQKFYHYCWKKYHLTYQSQEFIDTYEDAMKQITRREDFMPRNYMAQPPIVEFMKMLEAMPFDENQIYEIWKQIPDELKQNNIDCGVCGEDYYKDAEK